MQIVIKNRETLSGATTEFSPPYDVSGYALLTGALIVYAAGGTPTLDVALQTSDDLETWDDLSTAFTQASTTGVTRQAWVASTEKYGRYVRAKIISAGTDPVMNYSLFLNTFEST
jgi:hypothetical protein